VRSGASPVEAAVIGAGSWGTALAHLLHRNGHSVRLWSFDEDVVHAIRGTGENGIFLPGVALSPHIQVSSELDEVISGADLVLSVSPSQFVAKVMERAASYVDPGALLVSASKGIEIASLRRMGEVLGDIFPIQADRMVVLSGPSFASEAAAGLPTAVVAASRSHAACLEAQRIFRSETFRVYTNPDVIGVEVGGALKNVIALAAGVCAGLGFGQNTQAALITRGLAEITRLGIAMGAQTSTFYGLAGIGDLVLTCTGELSRNRMVGTRLGGGETIGHILSDMKAVAEGVRTAAAAHALASRFEVEMPIVEQMYAILEEGKPPLEAVKELMLRDPRPESDGKP
jgi:glycerol-3-phosphate dehydrogenase (NAD(P)+)